MTAASYIPGAWLGIVRSRTAVLLGPGSPAELAGALWELLAGRPEPHEILAAVTSTSGGSLTRVPSFGILDFNGSLRVFLRGDIDLTVEQPGGAVDLDGRDVTTWTERKFVVPGTCRVAVADETGGTAGHAAEQPALPLGEGVVLLRSLTLGAGSGPAAVHAPAAADAVARAGTSGTDAAPVVPAAPATSAPTDLWEPDVPDEAEDLPETTLLPGHAASAETVLGVIEEDVDERPADGVVDPAEAAHAHARDAHDPDATIAPDFIIGVDGERGVDGGIGAGGDRGAEGEPAGEPAGGPTPVEVPEADAAGVAPTEGGAGPAGEMTTSYDHLWDRTVMRHIEDAAVREDPDDDSGQVSPQQRPALPAAQPLPAPGTAEDPAPEVPPAGSGTSKEADSRHDPAAGAGPGAGFGTGPGFGTGAGLGAGPGAGTPGEPAGPPRPASAGVLIDSVPWRTGGTTPAQASPAFTPPPTPGAPAAPASGTPAPRTLPPVIPAAADTGFNTGFDPDHDGQTVMKSSLPGTASGPASNPSAIQQDAGSGPLVLARVCAQGHANPPTHAQCSSCGAALLPDAVQVPRPRLGRMRLSTGELLELDQSMVIGRQPSVSRVQGGVMPRLVQVASPGGDISRSHVEVRLEGWHVMLCDLKATNGTVLVREGQPPRRLAQNEMAILLDGDIAELGDNISLRFEEIP